LSNPSLYGVFSISGGLKRTRREHGNRTERIASKLYDEMFGGIEVSKPDGRRHPD
jgi:hypothetical protein